MAASPARTAPLILEDTYVRQDEHGRFSLNDLHQAAGGEPRHKPSNWLANQQSRDLIDELDRCWNSSNGQTVKVLQGGSAQGTFVARELVYAYAMWISPAFHLKVIRTFDALVTSGRPAGVAALVGQATGLPLAQLTGLQDQAWKLITRLKAEKHPALRATLYDQLEDVYRDMGKQPPPLDAVGASAPVREHDPAATGFWAAFQVLVQAGVALNHARHPRMIALNLKQVVQAAQERGLRLAPSPLLKEALRTCAEPRFKDIRTVNSAVLGHSVHCWVFETAEAGDAA
jgi:hypothetical protein